MFIKSKNKIYVKLLLIFALLLSGNSILKSQNTVSICNSSSNKSLTSNTITIDEETVVNFLTQTLQERLGEKNATLELRLSRPWTSVTVTNNNGTLKLLDSPATIMPSMIVRFGWQNGNSVEVSWQIVVYARVWADVLIASRPLSRGTLLSINDVGYMRKDILQTREYLTSLPQNSGDIELVENVSPGQLILPRSIRIKPIVRRGQLANAYHIDGALNITLKVEVMEDGICGQYIKIKNPQTRKELKGKVQNDGSIEICL